MELYNVYYFGHSFDRDRPLTREDAADAGIRYVEQRTGRRAIFVRDGHGGWDELPAGAPLPGLGTHRG